MLTTRKTSQFTSAPTEDVSLRILSGELFLIQPFTDVGINTLAGWHARYLSTKVEIWTS